MSKVESVLVTGGAGFIGSNLCHSLIANGLHIICLDNFDSYYSTETKLNNIESLLNNPHYTLVKGDIRDNSVLDEVFSTHQIDFVVHLAAKAGVRHSISNPEEYYDVNVNGSICLLESMRKHGVKNLVFSSSSSVYGDRNGKLAETQICDDQISPYALSKRKVELLNYKYHLNSGFNVVNLRLFSVYGRNQRPDLVLHKFIHLVSNNKPIEVYGNTHTTRDYTYIDDTVNALLLSLDFLRSKQHTCEIFNIGSDHPVSLEQLIRLISKTINQRPIEVIPQDFISGEASHTHADIQKAKEILRYSPKVSIENGIRLFYDWYRGIHQAQLQELNSIYRQPPN